jgi:hypothetical protein
LATKAGANIPGAGLNETVVGDGAQSIAFALDNPCELNRLTAQEQS